MKFAFEDIVKITGGNVQGSWVGAGNEICSVVFDTRKLWSAETSSTLFVALKGVRDGHTFLGEAYRAGVRMFLVSRYESQWMSQFPGALFLVVAHTLVALQQWAAWHRKQLTGVVVGITGSNGKTIVKEWLGTLFKGDFSMGKSPRSYNSQLGVALSLLDIPLGTQLSLLEVGISGSGDMASLQEMVQPNLAVITHLGEAHAEGFSSMEEKAKCKVALAAGSDVVVYPYDLEVVRTEVSKLKSRNVLMKTIHWGWQEGAQFRITEVEVLAAGDFSASVASSNPFSAAGGQRIYFVHRGTSHQLDIPFMDSASVSNAMSCLCVLQALERWDPEHLGRFMKLPHLENRLQFAAGKSGNYILNDSYSADLESLGVALDMLKRQSPNLSLLSILGSFEQTGMDASALRDSILRMLSNYGVTEAIFVGEEYRGLVGGDFGLEKVWQFDTVSALMDSAVLSGIASRSILIKGSRSAGLERVANRLQARLHQTRLEINLHALKNNYLYFKQRVGAGKKVMCMVKAFGYGSGSFESARALQALAVDYLGVAYIDEGIALRNAGITVPIMVMNVDSGAAWQLQEYGLEPVVYSFQSLEGLIHSGVQGLKIHIEIDTGMHRLGFAPGDMGELGLRIRDLSVDIEVASVFSHLAASESEGSDDFTGGQLDVFASAAVVLEQGLGYTVLKHIENTGGILRFADARFTMVRLGIGLYGVDPRGVIEVALQPVTRWVSTISQVQLVKAGEGVGYGMHGVSDRDREIAVIAAGYADGLWRADGQANSGVWIKGVEAPFVGNICMDMAMVDVTGLNCKPGDEVELFGENLRVETLAQRRSTIPYEVLTAVSQRVARVYVEE
ncbi:bifunctional UDP-N-acetylmuramoyl-tripeptide:D-alanyl-D-alanine ligase/alanine racemase [Bacteroidota bacterium]|nr:bifunctional UDP-N-acetylmuramoyl-tripeptide:D-alanyl-D-alanine ligase/alanine racemase [Bacteroidota bacterium]